MLTDSLIAGFFALLAFWLSGARKMAYLLFFLAFIPFISIDPDSGGLRDVSGLGGQNVLFKLSVRLVTSAGLLLLLVRRCHALKFISLPHCWPILFYLMWSLIGLLQRPDPWLSVVRLGELGVFFMIGVCLYLEVDRFHGPRKVARWHCLALLPLCLGTLYATRTQPEMAYHEGLGGIRLGHHFLNANSLGFSATIVILWATHELREHRERVRLWVLERLFPLTVLLVAAVVLVYARSRTAMISVIVGQFVLWFPFHRISSRRRLVFVLMGLAAMATVPWQLERIADWFLRGDEAAVLLSGTGRVDLWKALLLEQVPRAPFFGSGYLTLSETGSFLHQGRWYTNAHNTYIFALVSTGIPGLVSVLAITLLPLRGAYLCVLASRAEDRSSWVLLFAIQLVVAVTGITGYGITGWPNPTMLFGFSIYLYCVAAQREAPTPLH